jgi:spoIIIJ-associated protein
MDNECIIEGPTVEDAVDAALEQLGVQQDAVEYEVLEEPSRKVFGMGGDRQAKVRVWIKESQLDSISQAKDIVQDVLGAEEPIPAELLQDDEPVLSEEELDKVADTAVATLRTVLSRFGIEDPTIEEYEGDEGEIILDVMGGELGLLIGRHGRNLDALQTAVGAITTHSLGFRHPVVVDVEGYRHRRKQKIEDIARRAADRSVKYRQSVSLRPMTAYERRVVHVALRGDNRVVTASEGSEPYRQVVINPK